MFVDVAPWFSIVLASMCGACILFQTACGLTFDEPRLRAAIYPMLPCRITGTPAGRGSAQSCFMPFREKQDLAQDLDQGVEDMLNRNGSMQVPAQGSAPEEDSAGTVHAELANIFVGLMPTIYGCSLEDPYLLHLPRSWDDNDTLHGPRHDPGLKLCFPRLVGRLNVVPGRIHFARDAVFITTASAARAEFNFSARVHLGSGGNFVGLARVALTKLLSPGRVYPEDHCITLRRVQTSESRQPDVVSKSSTSVCLSSNASSIVVDIGLSANEPSGRVHHQRAGRHRQDNVECRNDISSDEISTQHADPSTAEADNTAISSKGQQFQALPKVLLYYCPYEMAMFATLSPMKPESVKAARKHFRAACFRVVGGGSSSTDGWACSQDLTNLFNENEIHPSLKGLQITSGPFSGHDARVTLNFLPVRPDARHATYSLSLRHVFTRYHLQLALWGAVARGASPKILRVIAHALESRGGCAGNEGASEGDHDIYDNAAGATVLHSGSFLPFIGELSTPLIIAAQRGNIDAVRELLTWQDTFPKTSMCSPLTFQNRDGLSALTSAISFGNHTGFPKTSSRSETRLKVRIVSVVLAALQRRSDRDASISEMVCLAMQAAAGADNWAVLKLLMHSNITAISDPKVAGNGLALALMTAASQGHENLVEKVLEFDSRQPSAQNRLHNFLAPTVCDSFSRYSADVLLQSYSRSMTPLIAATKHGNPRIVRMVLEHLPQSIFLRDVSDMSALAWAVIAETTNTNTVEESAHRRRSVIKMLLDAGADPGARVQFNIDLWDFVQDETTRSLLLSSKLLRLQRNMRSNGRRIAVCFKGQHRNVFPRLWPIIRTKLIEPLEMRGRNTVNLFGVQAGDIFGVPDPGFHEGMFAPLKATGLYFHSMENQDKRTLISEYDILQLRSCFQLGIRGGSYGALEGLLLVVQDVGRCMDVIEAAEEKLNQECAYSIQTTQPQVVYVHFRFFLVRC